ncbi:MAG: outer membrane protein assembly factor [Deltaproteobacteria bacterium]|nr:MAG: outer membrane protein assembly factor [Deltaproteobacteria bacterium]
MIRAHAVAAAIVLSVAADARAQSAAGDGSDAPKPAKAPAQPPGAQNPAPVATPLPDVRAPLRTLVRYEVTGRLLEAESVVRAFLDQVMPVGNAWTSDSRRAVVEFCATLGYHASVTERTDGSGVVVTVALAPVTRVRRIAIHVNGPGVLHTLVQDKVFERDVRRRLRLQVGQPLPRDPDERRRRLAEEVQRLRDYLADIGFFEAKVRVSAVADGPDAAKLVVHVDTGPPYYVGRIRVVGNVDVDASEIKRMFHHTRFALWPIWRGWERRFDRAQLKRDIDRVADLYQRRGFPGVRVRTDFDRNTSFNRARREVDFTVIIRERRRIEVYFEGNDAISESRLRDQLTLDDEGAYDDFEIQRSAEAIERFYQSEGYFEATVLWERASFRMPDQTFDRIVFTITEGPKLKVKQIEFVGNHALSDATLRDAIKTREFPRFVLASGGYATSVQLEQDAQRIRALYQSRGYADVEVDYDVTRAQSLVGRAPALAAAILADLPAEGLFVRFIVREGKLHRVEDVRFVFSGAHTQTAAELQQRVSLRPGSAFTPDAAAADGETLRRWYFRNGFPYAKVDTRTQRTGPDRVVVVHTIAEGISARFGKVVVRGNFKTRDWVLREELDLPEGAKFTLGRAESAQRNLRTSGLFSNVRFDYVGLDDGNLDTINVVLNVQERYDYWLDYTLGAGASTDEGVFAEATARAPNMWGAGVRFEVTGLAGSQRQRLDSKLLLPRWVQRHWLGLGFRTEIAGFLANELTPRFGNLTSFGATVGAALEGQSGGEWDGWFVGLRYNFRQRNREEELVRVAGPNDDIEKTRVRTRTGAVGPQFVLDRRTDAQGRRNPLAPERGWRIELSALFADEALGGDDRFVKLGFKGLHYWKLGRRFLLTNGLRYDHGIPLGGAVVLPEVERFFAGGDTTVRGFEEDRLLTEIVETPLPPIGGVPQFRVLPAGGNIRLIHNVELQVQVWDHSFIGGLPWASALFLDTGLVTNSLEDFQLRQLRHSIGVAFWRLVTPVGSFSFEWAVPLDPQVGDNPRGRLHLNLGFVFK